MPSNLTTSLPSASVVTLPVPPSTSERVDPVQETFSPSGNGSVMVIVWGLSVSLR